MEKQWEQCYDTLAKQIQTISDTLYDHPELGNQEYQSSAFLCETLQGYGFTIEKPYKGIETAFRATLRGEKSGPTIALLAEYDALPGYGKDKNEVGHACGHNWIAALCSGVGILFANNKDKLQGNLVVMGCPAEETTGGKCELVEAGAFDDIDFALQLHLGAVNNANVCTLAMNSVQFTFHGKAAHAAAYPQHGINALDAVQLTFAGINCLRQHMQSDARVHGIITQGGEAVNTVPDFACAKFYVRAKRRDYMEELTQKIIRCAQGAELMSGATLEYSFFENSFYDLVNLDSFQALYKKNANLVGVSDFVDADEEASGSSDVGNVSYVCPMMYAEIAIEGDKEAYAHDEQFLAYMKSEFAYDKLRKGILSLVYTILDLYDENIQKEIKNEFTKKTNTTK